MRIYYNVWAESLYSIDYNDVIYSHIANFFHVRLILLTFNPNVELLVWPKIFQVRYIIR